MSQQIEVLVTIQEVLNSIPGIYMEEEENNLLQNSSNFYTDTSTYTHSLMYSHTLSYTYTHTNKYIQLKYIK